jgi:hypothetical protein
MVLSGLSDPYFRLSLLSLFYLFGLYVLLVLFCQSDLLYPLHQ